MKNNHRKEDLFRLHIIINLSEREVKMYKKEKENFEKSIPRYVDEHQVTVIKNLITSGKIPVYLAKAGYKVLVVGSTKKLNPAFQFNSFKNLGVKIRYCREFDSFDEDYDVLYMNYGKTSLEQLIKQENSSVVLIIEDSINCFNADMLISFARELIQAGRNIKLVILNNIEKYTNTLLNLLENSILLEAPSKFEYLPMMIYPMMPNNIIESLLYMLKHGTNKTFLVVLQMAEKNFQKDLQHSIEEEHLKNITILTASRDIRLQFDSGSFNRRIVIAKDSTLKYLWSFQFDVILDTGFESGFSLRNGVLREKRASQHTINTRRALAPCYYLCNDLSYENRKKFRFEIDLGFDQMVLYSIGKSKFKFLVSQTQFFYNRTLKFLHSLGLSADDKITETGNQALQIPMNVCFSSIFLNAKKYGSAIASDMLLCCMLFKFGPICNQPFDLPYEFRSDLFDQLFLLKCLYLEKELPIKRNQINRRVYKNIMNYLEKLDITITPDFDINVSRLKECLASGLNSCLFVLQSNNRYINEWGMYYNTFRGSKTNSEQFVLGLPSKIYNNFFISLPTSYSLEEVIEYFSTISYVASPTGNVFKKYIYQGIELKSVLIGRIEDVKRDFPEIEIEIEVKK